MSSPKYVSSKATFSALGLAVLAFLGLAIWATSGSGGLFPQGWADRAPASKAVPPGYISAQVLQPWPFSVKEGTLRCDEGIITFVDPNNVEYAVNGWAAASKRYVDLSAIWDRTVPINAVMERGLSLCPAS